MSVWISLEWAGADYEVEKVVLGSDEYRKINPLGAVPALDTGDEKIKAQANAILQYIAEKFPEADLGPDDSIEDRFLFNEIAAFITGDYHPAFWPMFGPDGYTTSDDEDDLKKATDAAYIKIDQAATHLDKLLEGKDHVYKNKKTVLDPYAFILSRWLDNTPKSWKEYPNLKAFMEKMAKDEAVQKVLKESDK